MDAVDAGLIHFMPDMAPCDAQAEFHQVKSHSGEHRSRNPKPDDVQKMHMKSLQLYIITLIGVHPREFSHLVQLVSSGL